MNEPLLRHVTCASPLGLHKIGYTQWGDAGAPVLLCVHGLTRNGRDFDPLASRLASRYRVVCPDMLGRGRSDFARDASLYTVPQYVADCITLIARLDVEEVTWLGTSMGGIIGMIIASMAGNQLGRLIINDIGPVVGQVGLDRISSYIGDDPSFASFEEGERNLRGRMGEFGEHSDEQFRYLSRHFVVQRNGRWTFHYDPALAVPFKAAAAAPATDLWPVYDAIRCPVRVLRGKNSAILSEDTAAQMKQRGPRAKIVEIPGVGHAPTLISDEQISLVESFLSD
ncbi:MAG: alpha/beta hydrolase [Quisquiliibacterium sp.]